MFLGNTCYVTTNYNENKFQLLLENHLKKRKGTKMSDELFEQCAAAYLACKDTSNNSEIQKMTHLLGELDIIILDYRNYNHSETIGAPMHAIKVFNVLSKDFLIETSLEH